MSSMFCTNIYKCKNAGWCARDFNPKSDAPECFEPLTNYDRIISKTPEELAQWIAKFCGCSYCPGFNVQCNNGCTEYWLDWLKQEVG